MKKYKVALFDVDGVMIIPPKLFSEQYCEQFGVDHNELVKFYSSKEFQASTLGKLDLKDAILSHSDLWKWKGEPEQLMKMWFEGEDYPNKILVEIISQLRSNGTLVYLATQQEQYRKQYLQEKVFSDVVDGIFCSCDIGYSKHDKNYWSAVLESLTENDHELKPEQIVYFDDKQNLVELAREFGIDGFVYKNPAAVKEILF